MGKVYEDLKPARVAQSLHFTGGLTGVHRQQPLSLGHRDAPELRLDSVLSPRLLFFHTEGKMPVVNKQ